MLLVCEVLVLFWLGFVDAKLFLGFVGSKTWKFGILGSGRIVVESSMTLGGLGERIASFGQPLS